MDRLGLAARLDRALDSGQLDEIGSHSPTDERDELTALLLIHELWTAPIHALAGRERLQGAPEIASVKQELEASLLATLDAWVGPEVDDADPVAAMRRIARADDNDVYDWLAGSATWDQLVRFLAIEGGPDGGFDDLVAVCQVGLDGLPKLTLAANYWDEMGRGEAVGVHTTLHRRLTRALELDAPNVDELPTSALRRCALNGVLATNRWLQPEMLGALGLLELQAGPRCRLVLQAFDRLGAPGDAYPFYVEHAEVDPVHGKDWMDKAVVPTVTERPEWGPRIVKGAWWRSSINLAFFESLHADLVQEGTAA
jgi:hypothetical protein